MKRPRHRAVRLRRRHLCSAAGVAIRFEKASDAENAPLRVSASVPNTNISFGPVDFPVPLDEKNHARAALVSGRILENGRWGQIISARSR